MAETKYNIAEKTCANCTYWEGQKLVDKVTGISFINPKEVAECGNKKSHDYKEPVTPSHSCGFWQEAL